MRLPPVSAEPRGRLDGKPRGAKLWHQCLVFVAGGAVVAVVAVAAWPRRSAQAPQFEYVTASVKRGDLEATLTATGKLRGRDTVAIRAEVSGTVSAVHVDFNAEIKKGQVLCEVDSKELVASLSQAKGQLAAARASYAKAKAIAKEAGLTVQRTRVLLENRRVSSLDLEAALAADEQAKASARSAKAQITLSAASLKLARTKLGKAKIRAPMDGVVLTRNVEVGQTIAASLPAPALFTVARNLRQMDLTLAIDEANVGQISSGVRAGFTVDAFPDRDFVAQLRSIHNVGTEQNGVVTYEALLAVANDDRALRPGMTAVATFNVGTRHDVLLVPNASLRFEPPSKNDVDGRLMLSGTSKVPVASSGMPQRNHERRVWVLRAGEPARVPVEAGLSNGHFTEILEGALDAGAEVIIDVKQSVK